MDEPRPKLPNNHIRCDSPSKSLAKNVGLCMKISKYSHIEAPAVENLSRRGYFISTDFTQQLTDEMMLNSKRSKYSNSNDTPPPTTMAHSSPSHKNLPELNMSFSNDRHHRHSRHPSTISQYFDASETSDDGPPLSALDSTAALILVHDDEEEPESPLPFIDDENEGEEDDELVSPMFELRRSAVFPPLRPALVFLYLLAPHLRLGALNIPYTPLPLEYALPALLLSALATAFSRQIWYMLARYIRKASMTDIFMDTFARGRGNEGLRLTIRIAVKTSIGLLGVFLSIVYLRCTPFRLPRLATTF